MATQNQIVVGTLAVVGVSGLLLFVGSRSRSIQRTQDDVEDAAQSGNALFDAAGDIIGELEPAVGELGGFIGEIGGLGRDIVGGLRDGLRLPGKIGGALQRAGSSIRSGAKRAGEGFEAIGRETKSATRAIIANPVEKPVQFISNPKRSGSALGKAFRAFF